MDEERMQQTEEQEQPLTWKDRLYSEKVMKYVNGILCLTLIFGIPLGTVVAYALWLAYLICGIIVRKDKTMRIAYVIMGLFALTVLVLNLVSVVKALPMLV